MQKIKVFSIIIIILSIFIKNISDVYGLNNDSSDISSKINAEGYVIMDANNHDILFSKNENNRYEPASVTKIMTAILVIENVQDLHTKITIGENPPKTEPSSIYLVQGEIIDIKSLLYALLLQSANDAAVALAEYVGGSVKGFEKMMNDKAAALGCTNTHFANPNGLHAENHYTTAKDMALILSYAIKNQTLLDISQTEQYFIPETNLGPVREIYNQNRILLKDNENYYDKAIFAKTGYTDEAQHTFAVAAKNDKMTLVAVFLKDSVKGYNIYAKDCLEYAFDNYTNHTIYNKGDFVINYNIKGTFVQLMAENSINITIKNGTNIVKNISDIVLIDPERYSYSKGEEVATSKLIINGISYDLALESKEDITLASTVNSIDNNVTKSIAEQSTSKDIAVFLRNKPNNLIISAAFGICIIICLLVIFIFLNTKYRKKNYRKRGKKRKIRQS